MPWVEVNGDDLYYIEAGEGQPLVLLHGHSSTAETWYQQFEHFRDRFRVIAYDSVNHGHSSNSPRDEDEPERVDQLEGFLAALGTTRPVLAGNSMGSNTILRWSMRHPHDALALISGSIGVRTGDAARPPMPAPIGADEIIIVEGPVSFTPRFKEEQSQKLARFVRLRSTATRIEARRFPRRPPLSTVAGWGTMEENAAQIGGPLLILTGEFDSAREPAHYLRRLAPHADFYEVPGAPHNCYFEMPDAWNAAVDAFLTRVLPSPATAVR